MDYNILNIIESNERIEDFLVLDILENKDLRSIFINQYGYFKLCNREKLSLFIKSNYSLDINNDLKIDLIDLSITINFFEEKIYNLIKLDLKKKKNYLVKLTMLDYINAFYRIPLVKKDYFLINDFIYNKSTNKLLLFQSLLNLSIVNDSIRKKLLINLSIKPLEPHYYYRIVNNFIDFEQFTELDNFKDFLPNLITNTNNLNSKQKEELLNSISKNSVT